ncbi:MAG: endonuclease [Bacteroidetes bacterium]|nr:endonuclease [Bacteroidota bacterium]
MVIKKSFFLLPVFSLLIGISSSAQNLRTASVQSNLPLDYYAGTGGLSCAPLKSALFNIIAANNKPLLYADVLTAHPRTDKRRNDANTADIVWDIYSDNPNGEEPYTFTFDKNRCGQYAKEGDCFNREHLFPVSWFNDELPMKADLNHIFPTDGLVNGMRANFPFGEVKNSSNITRNGGKLGTGDNFGYTGTVFEPINEYKGDIARALFYMAVRYESQIAGWKSNANADNILNGTSYPAFDDWSIRLLYKWHVQDPVSQKEKNRNDSVYVILGNRNPFIDQPEWVYEIWKCTGLIIATSLSDALSSESSGIVLYPNPTVGDKIHLQFKVNFSQPMVYKIIDLYGRECSKGFLTPNSTSMRVDIRHLSPGHYLLQIKGAGVAESKRFVVGAR